MDTIDLRKHDALRGVACLVGWPWNILTFFLLTAACFFPAFLTGKVYLSSTDNIHFWYPTLEIMRDNFARGEYGFWNPYILGGVSNFTDNFYTPFSLEFGLLYLLPQRLMYHGLSLIFFVHIWVTGIFAYLLLRIELKSDRWGFFAAVICQLSGYTIWALTSPAATAVLMYFTIVLYCVWSLTMRSPLRSFIYLTVAMTALLSQGHIAILWWVCVGLAVLFVYRHGLPDVRKLFSWSNPYALAAGGILCALLISTWHYVPVLLSLDGSTRIGEPDSYRVVFSTLFLGRLLNPELLGIHYTSAQDFMRNAASPTFIRHGHDVLPVYFGILPTLLIIWHLIAGQMTMRRLFWIIFAAAILSVSCLIEPITALYNTFFSPFVHGLGCEILLPLPFAVLAGRAGQWLVSGKCRPQRWQGVLMTLIVAVVFLWMIVSLSYHRAENFHGVSIDIQLIKVVLRILVPLLVVLYFVHRRWPTAFVRALPVAGIAGYVALCIIEPRVRSVISGATVDLMLLACMGVFCVILALFVYCPELSGRFFGWLMLLPLVVLAVMDYSFEPRFDIGHWVPSGAEFAAAVSSLGILRYVFCAAALMAVVYLASRKPDALRLGQGGRGHLLNIVFGFLLVFTVTDLCFSFRVHEHLVMNPRQYKSDVYPERFHRDQATVDGQQEMDVVNYRVTHWMCYFYKHSPWWTWRDEKAPVVMNTPMMAHLRSYAGIQPVLRSDLYRRAEAFRLDNYFKTAIPANATNERFLDLMAVRYDLLPKDAEMLFNERQSAFSRFMLFSHWRRVSREEALKLLPDAQFDYHQTLLVHGDTPAAAMRAAPARPVLTGDARCDTVALDVEAEQPGMLLFADNYDPGWQAQVNGRETPVIRANFNHMAIPLEAGVSHVVFTYRPVCLGLVIKLVAAGLGLFVVLAALIAWHSRRRGKGLCAAEPDAMPVAPGGWCRVAVVVLIAMGLMGGLIARWATAFHTAKKIDKAKKIDVSIFNGTPIASATNPNFPLGHLFDRNVRGSAFWELVCQFPQGQTVWVGMDFRTQPGETVTGYTLMADVFEPVRMPSDFVLQGSHDGQKWHDLDTQSDVKFRQLDKKTFKIANRQAYQYYRLLIKAVGNKGNIVRIAEMEFE